MRTSLEWTVGLQTSHVSPPPPPPPNHPPTHAGLVRGFDDRHGIVGKSPIYGCAETLPVLFIYGADKGFKFHSEKFEALLRERENGEVKAVGVRGEGGKVKKPAGHWIQDSCSDEINEWSREFFEKSHGADE